MEDAFAVSRDAGNPPVRFDVAGAGDGVMGTRGVQKVVGKILPQNRGDSQLESACQIRNAHPTNDNGAHGKVARRSRLGGLLNYYYRKAA
jgi:hypothetical protein